MRASAAWCWLLTAGRTLTTVEAAPADRGCCLRGCDIDIDGLRIDSERSQLRRPHDQRLRLRNAPPSSGRNLPTIDWELLGSYRVMQQGQRWTSVALVPWAGQHPGHEACRMLAYWDDCEASTDGEQPGEVVPFTVQAVAGRPRATPLPPGLLPQSTRPARRARRPRAARRWLAGRGPVSRSV